VDVRPAETTLYSLSDAPPQPHEDRRESGRLMTLYRVGSLSLGERRELCLIKNISAGGMMVRCYCSIPEGTRVAVELKCGQPLTGTVSWARDIHIGIAFDEPIDVIDILSTSSHGPRPRMPRIEVAGFITVREGASIYRMRVCDISQGGLKVQGETCLPVDADVVVTLSGIEPIHGVVRWTSDNQMGIIFNRLLPLPTLVEWLKAEREAHPVGD
jgi:hypothetical protein